VSYAEWQPAFYPPGLPNSRFLHHYATAMGACEVNATHYRIPSAATVAGWAEAVPKEFRFAVKATAG